MASISGGMAAGAHKSDMERAQLALQARQLSQNQQRINLQAQEMAYQRQKEAEQQKAAQEAQEKAERHGMASRKYLRDDMLAAQGGAQSGSQRASAQSGGGGSGESGEGAAPKSSTFSNYDVLFGQNKVWNEYDEINNYYNAMRKQRKINAQNNLGAFMMAARKNQGMASIPSVKQLNNALGMDGENQGYVSAVFDSNNNFLLNFAQSDPKTGKASVKTEIITPIQQMQMLGTYRGGDQNIRNQWIGDLTTTLKNNGYSTDRINKEAGWDVGSNSLLTNAQTNLMKAYEATGKGSGQSKSQGSGEDYKNIGQMLNNYAQFLTNNPTMFGNDEAGAAKMNETLNNIGNMYNMVISKSLGIDPQGAQSTQGGVQGDAQGAPQREGGLQGAAPVTADELKGMQDGTRFQVNGRTYIKMSNGIIDEQNAPHTNIDGQMTYYDNEGNPVRGNSGEVVDFGNREQQEQSPVEEQEEPAVEEQPQPPEGEDVEQSESYIGIDNKMLQERLLDWTRSDKEIAADEEEASKRIGQLQKDKEDALKQWESLRGKNPTAQQKDTIKSTIRVAEDEMAALDPKSNRTTREQKKVQDEEERAKHMQELEDEIMNDRAEEIDEQPDRRTFNQRYFDSNGRGIDATAGFFTPGGGY